MTRITSKVGLPPGVPVYVLGFYRPGETKGEVIVAQSMAALQHTWDRLVEREEGYITVNSLHAGIVCGISEALAAKAAEVERERRALSFFSHLVQEFVSARSSAEKIGASFELLPPFSFCEQTGEYHTSYYHPDDCECFGHQVLLHGMTIREFYEQHRTNPLLQSYKR